MIEEVISYKTEDGKTFHNKKLAEEHEASIKRTQNDRYECFCFDNNLTEWELNTSQIYEAIITSENSRDFRMHFSGVMRDILIHLFNDFYISPRLISLTPLPVTYIRPTE